MLNRLKDSLAACFSRLPSPKQGEIWEVGPRSLDEPVDIYVGKIPREELGRWQRWSRALIHSTLGYEYETHPKTGLRHLKPRVYTQGMLDQSLLALRRWRKKHNAKPGITDRIVLAQALHPLFNGPDALDSRIYVTKEELLSYIGQNHEDVDVLLLEEMSDHQEMFSYLFDNRSDEDGTFLPPAELKVPDFSRLLPHEYSRAFLQALICAYQKGGPFSEFAERAAPLSAVSHPNYTLVEMAFRLADLLNRQNIQGGAERQLKYNELLESIVRGQFSDEMPELHAFVETQKPVQARFMRIKPRNTYADSVRERRNARSRWALRLALPAVIASGAVVSHKYESYKEKQAYLEAFDQARRRNAEMGFRGYSHMLSRWDPAIRTIEGSQDDEALYLVEDLAELAYQRYPELQFLAQSELEQQFMVYLQLMNPGLKADLIRDIKQDRRIQADFVDSWYVTNFLALSARNHDLGTEKNRPYHHILKVLQGENVLVDNERFDTYPERDVEVIGRFQSSDPDGMSCYEVGVAPSSWRMNINTTGMGIDDRTYNDDYLLVVARECWSDEYKEYREDFFPAMGAQAVLELAEVSYRWNVLPYMPYIEPYCNGLLNGMEFVLEGNRIEGYPNRILENHVEGPERVFEARVVSDYYIEDLGRNNPLLLMRKEGQGPWDLGTTKAIIRDLGWCTEVRPPREFDNTQSQLRHQQEDWHRANLGQRQAFTPTPR